MPRARDVGGLPKSLLGAPSRTPVKGLHGNFVGWACSLNPSVSNPLCNLTSGVESRLGSVKKLRPRKENSLRSPVPLTARLCL